MNDVKAGGGCCLAIVVVLSLIASPFIGFTIGAFIGIVIIQPLGPLGVFIFFPFVFICAIIAPFITFRVWAEILGTDVVLALMDGVSALGGNS